MRTIPVYCKGLRLSEDASRRMLSLWHAPISIATNHRARGEKINSYLHGPNITKELII